MYTLRFPRTGLYVWGGFAAFFAICGVFAMRQQAYGAVLIFAIFALWGLGYAIYNRLSSVSFDLSQPELIIKTGFGYPVRVAVAEVVALTSTKGGYVNLDKVVYKVNGRRKSLVVHSGNLEADHAWVQFCNKYLAGVRDKRTAAHHEEFEKILSGEIDPNK